MGGWAQNAEMTFFPYKKSFKNSFDASRGRHFHSQLTQEIHAVGEN